jgi:hypothetical protein
MKDQDDKPPLGLDRLYSEREPPGALEARVAGDFMHALAERYPAGAAPSDSPEPRRGAMRQRLGRAGAWQLQIAAGIVVFLAGFGVARLLPGAEPVAPAGGPDPVTVENTDYRRFMLLLWERPGFASGVAPGQLVAEYADWARATAGSGVPVSGHELGADRALIRPGEPVPSAAPGEGDRLSGYFVVEVPDVAAARRLAAGHPHLGYGGWIEIAEVL